MVSHVKTGIISTSERCQDVIFEPHFKQSHQSLFFFPGASSLNNGASSLEIPKFVLLYVKSSKFRLFWPKKRPRCWLLLPHSYINVANTWQNANEECSVLSFNSLLSCVVVFSLFLLFFLVRRPVYRRVVCCLPLAMAPDFPLPLCCCQLGVARGCIWYGAPGILVSGIYLSIRVLGNFNSSCILHPVSPCYHKLRVDHQSPAFQASVPIFSPVPRHSHGTQPRLLLVRLYTSTLA